MKNKFHCLTFDAPYVALALSLAATASSALAQTGAYTLSSGSASFFGP